MKILIIILSLLAIPIIFFDIWSNASMPLFHLIVVTIWGMLLWLFLLVKIVEEG